MVSETGRDWRQMTDAERGIIRCERCGVGLGAEHENTDGSGYTCPECTRQPNASTLEQAVAEFHRWYDPAVTPLGRKVAIEAGVRAVLAAKTIGAVSGASVPRILAAAEHVAAMLAIQDGTSAEAGMLDRAVRALAVAVKERDRAGGPFDAEPIAQVRHQRISGNRAGLRSLALRLLSDAYTLPDWAAGSLGPAAGEPLEIALERETTREGGEDGE